MILRTYVPTEPHHRVTFATGVGIIVVEASGLEVEDGSPEQSALSTHPFVEEASSRVVADPETDTAPDEDEPEPDHDSADETAED